ncbi:MAG: hypothetical protein K2Y32_14805 [Candidatus Obscuribacterales bacterium]|nr:hypothetical protein [Candidatus Obscuribacterales bacterium]
MPSTVALVAARFVELPLLGLLVTRELLDCGTRTAVDNALYRLVKLGIISRVARGVFVRSDAPPQAFTAEKIAEAKAKAFCRSVLKPHRDSESMYITDSCSTSFDSVHGRIVMKRVSARKLRLAGTSEGRAMLEIWMSGRCAVNAALLKACIGLPFARQCGLLPQWLSEMAVNFGLGDHSCWLSAQ